MTVHGSVCYISGKRKDVFKLLKSSRFEVAYDVVYGRVSRVPARLGLARPQV